MTDDTISEYLKAIGTRGGKKTARRGPAYYRDLQRRSVVARRRNAAKATTRRRLDAETH